VFAAPSEATTFAIAPSLKEYVDSGRAIIENARLCLLTGRPIPNDGSGRGLKHVIDSWIAANSAPVTDNPKDET
jgi:hypothetical protein